MKLIKKNIKIKKKNIIERERELVVGVNELQYSVLTYISQTLRENLSVRACVDMFV